MWACAWKAVKSLNSSLLTFSFIYLHNLCDIIKKVMLMSVYITAERRESRREIWEANKKIVQVFATCFVHFQQHPYTQVLHMTCTLLLGGSRYSHYFFLHILILIFKLSLSAKVCDTFMSNKFQYLMEFACSKHSCVKIIKN